MLASYPRQHKATLQIQDQLQAQPQLAVNLTQKLLGTKLAQLKVRKVIKVEWKMSKIMEQQVLYFTTISNPGRTWSGMIVNISYFQTSLNEYWNNIAKASWQGGLR
jgi:hypothetical protein